MARLKTIALFLIGSILYSTCCYAQTVEERILLINAGDADRGELAKAIVAINGLNPRVLSLDLAFSTYSGDAADRALSVALADSRRLVMPAEIYSNGEDYYGKEMISFALLSPSDFFPRNAKAGFVTALSDSNVNKIPRDFSLWQQTYTDHVYRHFSFVTAMAYDSLRAMDFAKSHERVVAWDWQKGKRVIPVVLISDVLKGKLTKEVVTGKIVIIGYVGPGSDDKFISPLNSGTRQPDMYGVQYLSSIVLQILDYKQP
jgi:CHASE2 domain-containing sensor protein